MAAKALDVNECVCVCASLHWHTKNKKAKIPAKMGSIKDRNGMDLTEAEILRRGGKNTQKNCTKKIFTIHIITMV